MQFSLISVHRAINVFLLLLKFSINWKLNHSKDKINLVKSEFTEKSEWICQCNKRSSIHGHMTRYCLWAFVAFKIEIIPNFKFILVKYLFTVKCIWIHEWIYKRIYLEMILFCFYCDYRWTSTSFLFIQIRSSIFHFHFASSFSSSDRWCSYLARVCVYVCWRAHEIAGITLRIVLVRVSFGQFVLSFNYCHIRDRIVLNIAWVWEICFVRVFYRSSLFWLLFSCGL